MELERFVGEVSASAPCGADLDEAGELFQLDMLAKWADPEAEPDWRELQQAAVGALEKTRDLRVGVYLAAALLHTEGVVSFCKSLGLLRRWLETWWDELYPLLDEGDAAERCSALVNLTEYYKVLKPLRTAVLVEDRAVGRFSLFDHEVAEGKVEWPADQEGEPPTPALISAAFTAVEREGLETLAGAVRGARDDLAAIESQFRDKAPPDDVPDLARLDHMLGDMEKLLGNQLAQRQDAPAPDGTPADAAGEGTGPGNIPAAAAAVSTDGQIRSREDAVRALERVMAYFQSHEPSSPVPLLLQRAKRLVHMDFMDILQDMAPEALQQVQTISGRKSTEDE